jgi:non-ribosomal peptide synthetase component F
MAASGAVLTYAELEARSNRVAWLARRCGLGPGDGLAAITENRPELLELAWGAQRSGLQFTAVNWHPTAAEAGTWSPTAGPGWWWSAPGWPTWPPSSDRCWRRACGG